MIVQAEKKQTTTWTISLLLEAATAYLAKHKIEAARLNAELLLAHSLRFSRLELYLNFNQPLNKLERQEYKNLLIKRAQGVPLQYLLGTQPFRYLNLTVTEGVFIPRPETEVLVEQVVNWVQKNRSTQPLNLLDIGTGSGAIALSLAYELKLANVWATDVSRQALAVAHQNAAKHGLSERLTFLAGPFFQPLPANIKFDVIVSNPPYVKEEDLATLPPDVQKEPKVALAGGVDGLDFYRAFAKEYKPYLVKDGLIAFEVGDGQAEPVGQMFAAQSLTYKVFKDLNSKERVVLIYANYKS